MAGSRGCGRHFVLPEGRSCPFPSPSRPATRGANWSIHGSLTCHHAAAGHRGKGREGSPTEDRRKGAIVLYGAKGSVMSSDYLRKVLIGLSAGLNATGISITDSIEE